MRQLEEHQDGPLRPLRRQRLKISNACQACRLKKAKCDGCCPACTRCRERGKICIYGRDSIAVGQQTKPKPIRVLILASPPASRAHSLEAPSTSTTEAPSIPTIEVASTWTAETPPTTGSSSTPEHLKEEQHQDPDQSCAYPTAHGPFAGDVAAAIDVRAGLTPAGTSNLVPFVDAPLFGGIDLHSPYGDLAFATELPPRIYSDRLVGIYWEHIHPVEPIFDRDRFSRDYEASYSRDGALICADRDVWLGTLNVVFALAVQRQESTPLEGRNGEGNRYFQRAWALLRPGTILWKPGSVELVQCLILMNRYLHCTNNQQKTWVTAGLAMRIAQSLCCDLPGASLAKNSSSDRLLKQRVWASCVALDRCISWSLGRTSAPSLTFLQNRTDSISSSGSLQQGDGHAERLRRSLELHEICNQIQLAQTQARNNLATKLGLPRLYQQDEYHTVAVQLDVCLNKWENDLPDDWKLQNIQKVVDRTSRPERYVLHLRLLHARIFLYRPMLARVYSMKSHTATALATSKPPNLGDRLLKECAAMCVETAQKVTALIIETLEPDEPIGILPWWYRIYYLHIAGTNFLAAMFRSDLFTESVSQSWHDAISALRTHGHLSTYVPQCIRTFETLSARILETRHRKPDSSKDAALEGGASSFFDDILQDQGFDFDFDAFLFGMEDVT